MNFLFQVHSNYNLWNFRYIHQFSIIISVEINDFFTVLCAGMLTLLQPETKGRGLTDHVDQEVSDQVIELTNNKE